MGDALKKERKKVENGSHMLGDSERTHVRVTGINEKAEDSTMGIKTFVEVITANFAEVENRI